MRYLALIYTTEVDPATIPPEALAAQNAAYAVFTRAAQERGAMLAGEALEPTSSATTVRVRDGRTLVSDGPFAETKEALGGFYLLECPDLDAAIELAARIPGAAYGSIEIRPIWELQASMPTTTADG
ncbi:MAG: YciI family protein [Candidatus Limnocylindrales bacterium]